MDNVQKRLMSFQSWRTSTWRLARWSETKRTIVFSRTKFEGQDWRRERKIFKNIRQQRSDKGSESPCRHKNCKNPSCKFWLRPVCRICKSEFGCEFGRTCFHRHVEADEKPNKKSKIGRAKGSVALVKESTQLGCVSRFLSEKVSFYVKKDNWYQNHADKFSKGRWHHMKNRKSVNLMSVVSARLILRRGHKRKPCTKNDAPAEQHGLGETYLQAQECG